MIEPGPAALRRALRAHNRHALALAALSALAAALAWGLAWFLLTLVLLGLDVSARGDLGAKMPDWIPATATGLAAALLGWGLADAVRRRFRRPEDHPIIGRHLIGEFLLLPTRLLLAVPGNLGARRHFHADDADRAWALLGAVAAAGRHPVRTLAQIEPDPARRTELLATLQTLGYLDLVRGENDWFYHVPSPRLPEIRTLLAGEAPPAK